MNFFKHMLNAYRMWKLGFQFSDNIHKDKDGEVWGFYRINHKAPVSGKIEWAIIDIDFSSSRYCHVHGGPQNTSIYRSTWENK